MKTAKKITALILTAVLCFCVVSCATSSEPEIVPEYDSSYLEEDMNGYVMDFSYALTNTSDDEVVLGYIPNTQLADIAAKRIKDVETRYNCKINIMYGANFSEGYDRLKAATASGLHFCDLISNESFALVNLMRAGYLIGLSDYLDMNNYDKWGTPDMLYCMCWDDDVYAVVPNSWPELVYTSFGFPLCVNNDLVTKFGGNDLREYVETYTWTWDKFEETLHFLTRTDGDTTVYGISCHNPCYYSMMGSSNGDKMVETSNGQITCGYLTATGRVAFERAKMIQYVSCKECFYPSDGQDLVVEVFKNGESCMICPASEYIFGNSNAILYKVENVAIIPFPMGPNATDYSTQGGYSSLIYSTSIPVTCNDIDITVKLLDAMYEPFDEYKTKEDVIAYMTEQVFFDERDTRMFVSMRQTAQYNFFLEKATDILYDAAAVSGTSLTALFESYENKYENIAEEYMIHHNKGMEAVWGK